MGGDDMTEMATVWLTGIVCWLMIGIPTTLLMITSQDREDVRVRNYISPGAVCVLMLTRIQRQIMVSLVDQEEGVTKPLESFRRQLIHAKSVDGVPVYRGQVDAVSTLAAKHGMTELAQELRRK